MRHDTDRGHRRPRSAARSSPSRAIPSSMASRRRAATKPTRSSRWQDGRIVDCGPAREVAPRLPPAHRGRVLRQRADHGRLHRRARPLSAGPDHRRWRQAAARLARRLHVPDGEPLRGCGHAREVARCLPHGEPAPRHHDGRRRSAPCTRPRSTCCFEEAQALRAADDRRQGADGPQRAGRTARHRAARLRRIEGAARALARHGPAELRDHAAIRRDVDARRNSTPPVR